MSAPEVTSVVIERFGYTKAAAASLATMVAFGAAAGGEPVVVAVDRATYLMALPYIAAGEPVGVEVESWRILPRKAA